MNNHLTRVRERGSGKMKNPDPDLGGGSGKTKNPLPESGKGQ
jgi:hypothetical protein